MNTLILSIIPLILSSISVIIIGISAMLLWKQIEGNDKWNRTKIEENDKWNRTKASQETLNNLVTGEFPDLMYKLMVELKCTIMDKSQTYEDRVKGLSKEKIGEIDWFLMRFLSILEAVAINIKTKIIDEDICYEYSGWIMTEYYRWSKKFIIKMREKTGERRMLYNFEECAQRWTDKKEERMNEGELR